METLGVLTKPLVVFGTEYARLLTLYPLPVKSITSGLIAGLGNYLSQEIDPKRRNGAPLRLRSILASGVFGLLVSGPIVHLFLNWLDAHGPSNKLLQLLLDRFAFAPLFLIIVLYTLPRLEGSSHREATKELRTLYWSALKMCCKVWILAQYFNLNFVPLKYRVLVTNLVSVAWNMYLSTTRRKGLPPAAPTPTDKDKVMEDATSKEHAS